MMLHTQTGEQLLRQKPCSCPVVPAAVSGMSQLPLLDLPTVWNNSLPVLSRSVSSSLMEGHDSVYVCPDTQARIPKSERRSRDGACVNIETQETSMDMDGVGGEDKKRLQGRMSSSGSQVEMDKSGRDNESLLMSDGRRQGRKVPHLTIDIPRHISSRHASPQHSPVPIPVSPKVMIQSSTHSTSQRRSSNTSFSSSSTDIQPGLPFSPSSLQIGHGSSTRIPFSHLLSPSCDGRSCRSQTSPWSNEPSASNIPSPAQLLCTSPPPCDRGRSCSFKYRKTAKHCNSPRDQEVCVNNSFGKGLGCCDSNSSDKRSLHQRRLSDFSVNPHHLYNDRRRLSVGVIDPSGGRLLPPSPSDSKPLSPKPLSPTPLSPKPLSPKPLSPKPLSPKPLSPKPLSPTSNTLQVPSPDSRLPSSQESHLNNGITGFSERQKVRKTDAKESRESPEDFRHPPAGHRTYRRCSDFTGIPSKHLLDHENSNKSLSRRRSISFHQSRNDSAFLNSYGGLLKESYKPSHPFSLQALFHPSGLFSPKTDDVTVKSRPKSRRNSSSHKHAMLLDSCHTHSCEGKSKEGMMKLENRRGHFQGNDTKTKAKDIPNDNCQVDLHTGLSETEL